MKSLFHKIKMKIFQQKRNPATKVSRSNKLQHILLRNHRSLLSPTQYTIQYFHSQNNGIIKLVEFHHLKKQRLDISLNQSQLLHSLRIQHLSNRNKYFWPLLRKISRMISSASSLLKTSFINSYKIR